MKNKMFGSRFYGSLVFLCLFFNVSGQMTAIKPLKKGDMLPDLVLTDRQGKPVGLTAPKNKLLIIDFWNTHCLACARAFLKLDSLKSVLKDSIQIVSVTHHNEEQAVEYFTKIKRKPPSFPLVVGDTVLKKLFPHAGDPYYVWVMNGKILHISNDWSLNYKNIKELFAGKKLVLSQRLALPTYKDDQTLLAPSMPLEKYALILTGLEDYNVPGSKILRDSIDGQPYYLKLVNKTKLELFARAYWKDVFGFEGTFFGTIPNQQMLVDSSAIDLVQQNDDTEYDNWRRENFVTYEVKVNLQDGTDLYKEMQKDLHKYFPYEVVITTRNMPALVLEIVDPLLFEKAKNVKKDDKPLISQKKNLTEVVNLSLSNSIVNLLTMESLSNGTPPCINNTGFDGAVSIRVDGDFYNRSNLRAQLKRYGLKLVEKDFSVKVLTIKKR